jgi:hypothetical protein
VCVMAEWENGPTENLQLGSTQSKKLAATTAKADGVWSIRALHNGGKDPITPANQQGPTKRVSPSNTPSATGNCSIFNAWETPADTHVLNPSSARLPLDMAAAICR